MEASWLRGLNRGGGASSEVVGLSSNPAVASSWCKALRQGRTVSGERVGGGGDRGLGQ